MNKSDYFSVGESTLPLQVCDSAKPPLNAPSVPEIPFRVGESLPGSLIACECDNNEERFPLMLFAPSSLPSGKQGDNAKTCSTRQIGGETTSKAPSPTNETPMKKISWCKRVRVKETRHINDYTDGEKAATWMTAEDYQMAKAIAKRTVMMIMQGVEILEDNPNFCTRGLEFRTKAGYKIRTRSKLRTRSAVLNEQDLQREEGFFDPEFIAMASMEVSLGCREGARKRACLDAKCIEGYLDDVRQGFF
jgi:hypothetical protein